VLYSQMEADYKKLQDRPAHARAGVRAHSHAPRKEAVTVVHKEMHINTL